MRISDWSSDVCSSESPAQDLQYRDRRGDGIDERSDARRRRDAAGPCVAAGSLGERGADDAADRAAYCAHALAEIGRASCRERGCQYVEIPVVDVSLKQKRTTTQIQRHRT